ncbi:protein SIEVE ELEMENT OCCLUSION B-like [Corylus avellana]|uniref:protein SIEVE ELEMENT OCCLUSION B-like n=1 Tax=Corylus avellana TaxID=13451 RepID=UPI00286AD66A|nr:protein SIEVE ELEMENT OCCLUSION B-like [Corylus avellana]
MASDMIEGELNVLTMSNDQIVNLISPTHLPAEEKFDAGSLFVVVKNILIRVTDIARRVCWGREHLEKPEEKALSRASFDPLLCTLLKQVSYEMACKAPGVEIAHKTTMSILDKLSSYSWNAKAVLTLAAFALDYEDIILLALAQLHSSHQLVQSVEHIPAGMLKYNRVSELNGIIYYTLTIMEPIFELKKLSTINKDINHDEAAYVYWIIITIVACIPHMRCLTSDEDKTQDSLPLDPTISDQTLVHLMSRMRISRLQTEEKKAGRKLKEFLQTPDEILEVFKELIFARNDVQPLIDGLTNEMVSIDVLKKKNVLLFISSLNISNDDISILMLIYDGIREKRDQYKIVWIPIVEQWTDDLRKKFEMLRSKMPWYIVQYFSPVTGIKFIEEEWHFENMIRQVDFTWTFSQCITKILSWIRLVGPIWHAQITSNSESKLPEISIRENKPIVVVMNPQGDVVNENAFNMIQERGMEAFPFSRWIPEFRMAYLQSCYMTPPGPYAIEEYTFLCGGKNNIWIKQFSKKVNVVAEDPVIKEAYISIELSCNGKSHKQQPFWKRTKTPKKTESDLGNQEIQKLLHSFKNESRWAVLTKWSTRVVSDHGTTILKVLEAFEEWKVNVPKKGFEICFKEYHEKFLHRHHGIHP